MRILFHKLSDDRHVLEIMREDGRSERMECETRSYLMHDFLHYAVESEAGTQSGVWGNLARGKTLADLNDRTGKAMQDGGPEMAIIERIVGGLSGLVKGYSPESMTAALCGYADQLGAPMPDWFNQEFVRAVEERMRRLVGRWKATPYGAAMDLTW